MNSRALIDTTKMDIRRSYRLESVKRKQKVDRHDLDRTTPRTRAVALGGH